MANCTAQVLDPEAWKITLDMCDFGIPKIPKGEKWRRDCNLIITHKGVLSHFLSPSEEDMWRRKVVLRSLPPLMTDIWSTTELSFNFTIFFFLMSIYAGGGQKAVQTDFWRCLAMSQSSWPCLLARIQAMHHQTSPVHVGQKTEHRPLTQPHKYHAAVSSVWATRGSPNCHHVYQIHHFMPGQL